MFPSLYYTTTQKNISNNNNTKQQYKYKTLFYYSHTGDLSFVQVKHQHVRYLFEEVTIILVLDSFKTCT